MEYLRFVGEAKGLKGEVLESQIEDVIKQTKIHEVRNRRISALSKGYKQRVGIAQALLGNPKVIILDEPTVGLDPIQIIEIRALIKELGQTHTVIFSSHILSEVQTICDEILIIAKGKLVAFDKPEMLEKRLLTPNEIVITADMPENEIRAALSNLDYITEISAETKDNGFTTAQLRIDHDDIYEVSGSIFDAFAKKGKVLFEMVLKRANLEDVFIELTESGAGTNGAGESSAGANGARASGAGASGAGKSGAAEGKVGRKGAAKK